MGQFKDKNKTMIMTHVYSLDKLGNHIDINEQMNKLKLWRGTEFQSTSALSINYKEERVL